MAFLGMVLLFNVLAHTLGQNVSPELSKRMLLGDTDYLDSKLKQMEQVFDAKIQNLTQTISSLQNKVAEIYQHIAFYATLTNHTTIGIKQVIEFDKVVTNIGHAYNGISGVFTIPLSGLYQFSTTMLQYTSASNKDIHTEVMQNNDILAINYGNANRASATVSVVISAQKGDIVYVRHHSGLGTTPQTIHGMGYSSFSGFKLS